MAATKHDRGKPQLSLISPDVLDLLIPGSVPHELRAIIFSISRAGHANCTASAMSMIAYSITQLREYIGSVNALTGCANGLVYGMQKYTRNNWKGGMEWSRVLDAALRHLVLGPCQGESTDEESGNSHYDHALCCLMFLYEYMQQGIGVNDLWEEPVDIWEAVQDE